MRTIRYEASRGKFNGRGWPEGTKGVSIEVHIPDGVISSSSLISIAMERVRQEVDANYRAHSDGQQRVFKGARLSGKVPLEEPVTNTIEAALRDALERAQQIIGDGYVNWHEAARQALSQPSPASSTAGEALDAVRMGLDFAYRKGLHEFGYDPVAVLSSALSPSSGEPASVAVEAWPSEEEWNNHTEQERLDFLNRHYRSRGALSKPTPVEDGAGEG